MDDDDGGNGKYKLDHLQREINGNNYSWTYPVSADIQEAQDDQLVGCEVKESGLMSQDTQTQNSTSRM